ncbi:hypothetical protein PR048_018005 [Dryococelus australis]|uniref:HTH CENPB-type domain-containing protein n=1 Tax=Dryococelus australis TaxID=614101 RepID=A0ABQ9HB58_9NEOP|nr:hypothetical protein PR048_018005 [Dryococelus australis]
MAILLGRTTVERAETISCASSKPATFRATRAMFRNAKNVKRAGTRVFNMCSRRLAIDSCEAPSLRCSLEDLAGPLAWCFLPAFDYEECGRAKGDTATRFKGAIAANRKALNWCTWFLSHCVYLCDFQRCRYYFISVNCACTDRFPVHPLSDSCSKRQWLEWGARNVNFVMQSEEIVFSVDKAAVIETLQKLSSFFVSVCSIPKWYKETGMTESERQSRRPKLLICSHLKSNRLLGEIKSSQQEDNLDKLWAVETGIYDILVRSVHTFADCYGNLNLSTSRSVVNVIRKLFRLTAYCRRLAVHVELLNCTCVAVGSRPTGIWAREHPSLTGRPLFSFGVAMAERLARLPPTMANRFQSPAESPDFRKLGSCRTMPLVDGFDRGSPVSPAPYSLQSPSSALETSLLRAAQNLFTSSFPFLMRLFPLYTVTPLTLFPVLRRALIPAGHYTDQSKLWISMSGNCGDIAFQCGVLNGNHRFMFMVVFWNDKVEFVVHCTIDETQLTHTTSTRTPPNKYGTKPYFIVSMRTFVSSSQFVVYQTTIYLVFGVVAVVVIRLHSLTKVNRVRFPAGSHSDLRLCESCQTMQLSGCGSPVAPVAGPVPTATAIVAPFSIANCETHEANVEFTRDLVVQLVENLPTKRMNLVWVLGPFIAWRQATIWLGIGALDSPEQPATVGAAQLTLKICHSCSSLKLSSNVVPKVLSGLKVELPVVQISGEHHSKGSQSPCKSVAISENSFTSVSGDGAEPGQLCSTDADKKHVDTDTDTTEYESAGDSTVPPSPLGSLAGDCYTPDRSDQSADISPVGVKCSPYAQVKQTTEKAEVPILGVELPQVQNGLNITGLCSAFEGVSLNSPQSGVKSPLLVEAEKPSNISGLCLALDGVHLNSPSSAVSESASDSICDSSLDLQSTPLNKEKLSIPFRTQNFAEYCKAVEDNREQSVSSLPASGEPPENVCVPVGSFSEVQKSLQRSKTPVVERCDTDAKLVVETEFFTELPNKTSTPTDETISTTEKAEDIVKELVETALESVLISSAEKAYTKFGEAFESTPDAIPATVVKPKCLEEETSLSVNSVSLSAVAKSLQETFELPEVSFAYKTEVTAEPLNQTFEVLTDVGQEPKSEVVQLLDTSFDFLPAPSSDIKTKEPLNTTFNFLSTSSGNIKTEEPLNTTFELLPHVHLDSKSQEVLQSFNKTSEQPLEDITVYNTDSIADTLKRADLLAYVQCENQDVAESLNKTFELITKDSPYKTKVTEQLFNTTFELEDEEFVGKHPEIEKSNSTVVNGEGKDTLFNGIDLNGNTQLQAVQRVKGECENFSRKSVSSPPVKFVSLSSERESKYEKNAVNISNCADQFLQQVLCTGESDTCEIAGQDHALPSHINGDEQSLPVQCEVSDTSKLIELYKICDEQQRDLEKDDEFVNAEAFFRNEQVVLKSSETSLCSSVSEELPKVKSDTTDFNREVTFEQISVEAKRLSQQFAISASEITANLCVGNVPDITEMENSNRVEGTNRSGLGSTPVSNKQSPRSVHGSRGSSPAKRPVGGDVTPKNKQKAVSNALKELDYTEVEDPFKPRSRIQNSPPREASVPCRDVCKTRSMKMKSWNLDFSAYVDTKGTCGLLTPLVCGVSQLLSWPEARREAIKMGLENFKASNGWLAKFKSLESHNTVCGEEAGVDSNILESWQPKLEALCAEQSASRVRPAMVVKGVKRGVQFFSAQTVMEPKR